LSNGFGISEVGEGISP